MSEKMENYYQYLILKIIELLNLNNNDRTERIHSNNFFHDLNSARCLCPSGTHHDRRATHSAKADAQNHHYRSRSGHPQVQIFQMAKPIQRS